MRNAKTSKLLLIFLVSLIPQLYYLASQRLLLWDSAVYIGMGKFLWSLGEVGLLEPLRPPLWPLILGFFWKLGLPAILLSKMASIIFGIGSIGLVYLLGEKIYQGSGFWASLLLAITPAYMFYQHWGLTEIPAIFFCLLAIWTPGYFVPGIIAGLAFLTKFPAGLILPVLMLHAWYLNPYRLLNPLKVIAGFTLPVVTYLSVNLLAYGSALFPFVEGQRVIQSAGIWLYHQPIHFYILNLFKENILFVLAVVALPFLWNHRKGGRIVLALILFLTYFTYLEHKEIRFLIFALPWAAILAGVGLTKLVSTSKITKAWLLLPLAVFIIQALPLLSEYNLFEPVLDTQFIKEYYGSVQGKILASDPRLGAYSDQALDPIYYPLIDSESLNFHRFSLLKGADAVLVNDCDMECPPKDLACETSKKQFYAILTQYKLEYSTIRDGCKYNRFSGT